MPHMEIEISELGLNSHAFQNFRALKIEKRALHGTSLFLEDSIKNIKYTTSSRLILD